MRSTLVLAIAALPFINALTISKTGQCGAATQLTCKGSTFGSCCSQYNYCGSTSAYCGTGCQSGYGTCGTTTPPVIPAKVSTDGSCGGTKGFTCLNSPFGNCCSQSGYCGKTNAYCGSGCNSKFGTCTGSPAPSSAPVSSSVRSSTRSSSTLTRASSTSIRTLSTSTRISSTSTRSSSVAAPSSTLKVSTNARCGKGGFEAFSCTASKYGDCCSQHSYCGSTDDYCSPQKNCQAGYGRCGPKPSSSSVGSSTSSSRASSSSTSQSSTSQSSTSQSSSSQSSSASSTVVSTTSSSVFACPSGLVTSISIVPRQIGADVTSCVPSTISTMTPSSSSSSSEVPSTIVAPTSSAAAVCPSATNIFSNTGFETGTLDPWLLTLTGDSVTAGVISGGYTGLYRYFQRNNAGECTTNLRQPNIYIRAGTVIDCSAWVYSLAESGNSVNFQILIDGQKCVDRTTSESTGAWNQISGQMTLSGDYHLIEVTVATSIYDTSGVRFSIDDVIILPVPGLEARTIDSCDVSSSVAVLPSSSSSSVDTATPTATLTPTPTSIPATTISSSSSACVPTSTNAIINPSFDTGVLAPWILSESDYWDTIGIVGDEYHSGGYCYTAVTIEDIGFLSLYQTINIPDGTIVDVSMWVKAEGIHYSTLFVLYMDGVGVPGGSVTLSTPNWVKVGGQVRLTGDTHTLIVQANVNGLGNDPTYVRIDDVYVGASVPTEGCPSTTTTAPAPPGETI